jgi:hypothetical protein
MKRLLLGLCLVTLIIGTTNLISGCGAAHTPPAIAANVATNGTVIVQQIKKIGEAVSAAEAGGTLPRNVAVTVMENLKKSVTAGDKVAAILDKLAVLPSSAPELPQTKQQLQDALTLVLQNLNLGVAFIPNEGLRGQVVLLVNEVIKTVSIINTALIVGVK